MNKTLDKTKYRGVGRPRKSDYVLIEKLGTDKPTEIYFDGEDYYDANNKKLIKDTRNRTKARKEAKRPNLYFFDVAIAVVVIIALCYFIFIGMSLYEAVVLTA